MTLQSIIEHKPVRPLTRMKSYYYNSDSACNVQFAPTGSAARGSKVFGDILQQVHGQNSAEESGGTISRHYWSTNRQQSLNSLNKGRRKFKSRATWTHDLIKIMSSDPIVVDRFKDRDESEKNEILKMAASKVAEMMVERNEGRMKARVEKRSEEEETQMPQGKIINMNRVMEMHKQSMDLLHEQIRIQERKQTLREEKVN